MPASKRAASNCESQNFENMKQCQKEYLDKILIYLNRIFHMNMVSQELYLNLSKQKKKLNFRYIKHIYKTLTEGKAEEVIYLKERVDLKKTKCKSNLKTMERMCWRVVEKIISKISYFMMNEQGLSIINPNVVKMIDFNNIAVNKLIMGKSQSIKNFIVELLDNIVKENNLLEKSIYEMLIDKGYIDSIDQFYRMNRLEAPSVDFVYSKIQQIQEESDQDESQRRQQIQCKKSPRSKKKFNLQGNTVKELHKRNKTQTSNPHEEEILQIKQTSANKSLESISSLSSADSQFAELKTIKTEILNKNTDAIHQELEKSIENMLKNQKIIEMMDQKVPSEKSYDSEDNKTVKTIRGKLMKHMVKNLHLRNFKANEKYLTMADDYEKSSSTFSKPDFSKIKSNQKKIKNSLSQNNRTSILSALNRRMQEQSLKQDQIDELKNDLLIKNFANFQNIKPLFFSSKTLGKQNSLKRNSESIGSPKRQKMHLFKSNFKQRIILLNKDVQKKNLLINFRGLTQPEEVKQINKVKEQLQLENYQDYLTKFKRKSAFQDFEFDHLYINYLQTQFNQNNTKLKLRQGNMFKKYLQKMFHREKNQDFIQQYQDLLEKSENKSIENKVNLDINKSFKQKSMSKEKQQKMHNIKTNTEDQQKQYEKELIFFQNHEINQKITQKYVNLYRLKKMNTAPGLITNKHYEIYDRCRRRILH